MQLLIVLSACDVASLSSMSATTGRRILAGRNFLRCVEGRTNSNLNIVVINDSGEPLCHVDYIHRRSLFWYIKDI